VCVFTYALIVITLMLPAVKLGEVNVSSRYSFDTQILERASAKGSLLTKKNPKLKKDINKSDISSKKKTAVKPKKIVTHTKKVRVATKKISRAYEGRVLMAPFGVSNYTSEDYNKMLKGTGLEGYGNTFKKMEIKYQVNGLYAIAVAMHESGLGKDPLKGNNYFGMIGMKFDSISDNIYYFGHLMSGGLYKGSGLTTISAIGSRYCVGDTWSAKVETHMRERAHKVG